MRTTSGQNRIEALAGALERSREVFGQLMARVQAEDVTTDFPAFAGEECYDPVEGGAYHRLPVDRDGAQLEFAAAAAPAGRRDADSIVNRIASGDNLDYMMWLLRKRKMAGKIQLIYVDPPFFTGAKYLASVQINGSDGRKSPVLKVGAYEDKWGHDLGAYLEMLAVRFLLMRELLAETGSLWVHLDWHGSHYVKMLLDEIFGPEHFVNEVVWTYKSGGASKKSFARKHDTLLFYGRTGRYKFHPLREKSYNREGKPYRFKGVEEFQDENGWYTMVNMKDVWSIDMVGRTSSERMGYATQKPEKLLERIVEACTDPGDLCADFFAGTGTLGAVCSRKGRSWLLCDEGSTAIGSQILRMSELADPFLVERPVQGQETMPRASAHVAVREGHIMLDSLQPDLTQVRQQDREIVAEYIGANSLDLVSFWSIDTAYDGKLHVGRRLLSGEDIAALPKEKGTAVSIVGYDLFGGRFEWTGEETER